MLRAFGPARDLGFASAPYRKRYAQILQIDIWAIYYLALCIPACFKLHLIHTTE